MKTSLELRYFSTKLLKIAKIMVVSLSISFAGCSSYKRLSVGSHKESTQQLHVEATPEPQSNAGTGSKELYLEFEERKILVNERADGPCEWSTEKGASSWKSEITDQRLRSEFRVFGVVSFDREEITAWKVNGERYPDLEGYLKLKLSGDKKPFRSSVAGRKMRYVLVTIPKAPYLDASVPFFDLKFPSSKLEDPSRFIELKVSDEFLLKCIPIEADIAGKVASIPAAYEIVETSEPVEIKKGSRFSIRNIDFEILDVAQSTERSSFGGAYSVFPAARSSLLVESNSMLRLQIYGSLIFPESIPKNKDGHYSVNNRGELVTNLGTDLSSSRVRFSKAHLGSDLLKRGTQKLFSNLNVRDLFKAQFKVRVEIPVWLSNVPIEMN